MGNLKFINSKNDDQFIMDHVRNKVNIYSEITKLREALKPYNEFLGNHIHIMHMDYLEIPFF